MTHGKAPGGWWAFAPGTSGTPVARRRVATGGSLLRDTGAVQQGTRERPGRASPARAQVDRSAERRVIAAGLLGSAAFLVSAVVVWLTGVAGDGSWAPLHLALAGGATLAIGALLPYFTTSLSVARPAAAGWRSGSLLLLAGGTTTAVIGVGAGVPGVGAAGAVVFLGGLAGTAATAFIPSRAALRRRGGAVVPGYAAALAEVTVGVSLAGLYLARVPAIVERWDRLEPAHAWLNLVGFVTLTIAATLIHLYPTVVGSRIRSRSVLGLVVGGLAAGPLLVALGYALASDPVARLGAALAILGGAALLLVAVANARPRGRWTTDLAWHRLVIGHLSAGTAWLAMGIGVAGSAVLVSGADPAGWSASRLLGPLLVGCVVQVLIGSWSHLVPAVGPGDVARHAVQRRMLGRWPMARLAALNGGALLIGSGVLAGSAAAVAAGAVLALAAVGIGVALLGLALSAGSIAGR
jgi:nitrite reductase (NO-forming)